MASSTQRNHHCWSMIPLDLMLLVFERLGFADFEQAKSVCTSWLSASRQSQPKNEIPWLILFSQNNNHVHLFNPEEEQKLYKTQLLGTDFAKGFCAATYRSWLLMVVPQPSLTCRYDSQLFILNVLTRQSINLPTVHWEYGLDSLVVFWIDEETKDYLLIRMHDEETFASLKKGGDSEWKLIPQLSGIEECCSMVYKDHKLYCMNCVILKIFDFSGDIPLEIFNISTDGYILPQLSIIGRLGRAPPNFSSTRVKHNLVVTVSGDVLLVRSIRPCGFGSKTWKFKIYKIDFSKGNKKWEKVVSLEDEAILLSLGVTVLAKDIQGLKRNSIYFDATDTPYDKHDENDVFIYNLGTKKIEQSHQFVALSIPCSNARWFLPSFKRSD